MQELKRKLVRSLRWVTTGAQMLIQPLYDWIVDNWPALVVGMLLGWAL
jgi:hypothetical protein